jgi:hypothetical protein
MSRATVPSAEQVSDERKKIDIATLDDRIAAILQEIEQEKVPERLLQLASALQQALIVKRQKKSPN